MGAGSRQLLAAASLLALAACESGDKAERNLALDHAPTTATAPSPSARAQPQLPPQAEPPPLPPAELHYGTGRFLRPTAVARSYRIEPSGDIILSFADADLREVVETVLTDILEVNYVIDPQVQGRVTLQTSEPLSEEALLPILESVLRLNNAVLVDDGPSYRIVPLAEATRQGAPLGVNGDRLSLRPGFGIQAVSLDYLPASRMAEILEPLAPAGAVLRADDARNFLLLAGNRSDLEALLDAVALFDVDTMAGMSFGYFPLRYANANALSEELARVLEAQEGADISNLIRLVPIERLNTLLVIAPQAAYLDRARDWIGRLDRSGEDDRPRLYVYYVENRPAAELAEVLNQLFGGESAATTPSPAAQAAYQSLRPDVETVELRSAESGSGATLPAPDPALAPMSAPASETPSGLAPGLATPALGAGGAAPRSSLRIMADEGNNALVILATLSDYRIVLNALEKLDLVPLQVLIEATIAEVTLNDDLRYGVEWFFQKGDSEITFSTLESGAVAPAFPGFSYLLAGTDVRVVLNALSAVTDVKVISSPKLMVLDNKTATLQVGDQVPIATQSAVSVVDPDAPIVNSVQFFDTGVILEVTPRVNKGGLVSMEISQEVSDAVSTTTSGIDSPTIRQRKIASSVAIYGGETVVLGGLIRDSRTRGRTGVPLLSDIPLLGNLFSATTNEDDRTELLVLITPRVVEGRDDARLVTDDLKRKLRGLKGFTGTAQ